MKKPMLLAGMALCILALAMVIATSYYNGTAERTITTDQAVILSLDSSQAVNNILLKEEGATEYSITAEVNKSLMLTENVSATLTVEFVNDSETKTLSNLEFTICEKVSGAVLQTVTGSGTLAVTNINETTEYVLKIQLKPRAEGRYTAEELKNTGGKFVVSFTSVEGGNNA